MLKVAYIQLSIGTYRKAGIAFVNFLYISKNPCYIIFISAIEVINGCLTYRIGLIPRYTSVHQQFECMVVTNRSGYVDCVLMFALKWVSTKNMNLN